MFLHCKKLLFLYQGCWNSPPPPPSHSLLWYRAYESPNWSVSLTLVLCKALPLEARWGGHTGNPSNGEKASRLARSLESSPGWPNLCLLICIITPSIIDWGLRIISTTQEPAWVPHTSPEHDPCSSACKPLKVSHIFVFVYRCRSNKLRLLNYKNVFMHCVWLNFQFFPSR